MKTLLAVGLMLLASPVFATPQVFPSRHVHKHATSSSKIDDCNPRRPDSCLGPSGRHYQRHDDR